VTSSNPERSPGGSGNSPAIWAFASKTLAIAGAEGRKLGHDPTELLTRAVQPALWMLVFGEVFTRTHAIPTGDIPYRDFMAPGILAQSVLFIAIFYGIAVIWERDLGIVHKMLVSPTPRTALVQAVIIYVLALVLGVGMNWSPLALAGVLCVVLLGAAFFSTFSLIIACIVRTRERFMGVGQLLTMPLFFASNAIYPLSVMPRWLRVVAHFNPLSYQVDALRRLMLAPTGSGAAGPGAVAEFGLPTDFAVLVLALVGVLIVGARLYPRIVR
jgi:ABC-2 type transport system permease protein